MTEETPLDNDETSSSLEEAKSVLSQLNEANAQMEKNLNRAEAMKIESMFSGTAFAGQQPEPKKELTPKEYADRVMAGEVP